MQFQCGYILLAFQDFSDIRPDTHNLKICVEVHICMNFSPVFEHVVLYRTS